MGLLGLSRRAPRARAHAFNEVMATPWSIGQAPGSPDLTRAAGRPQCPVQAHLNRRGRRVSGVRVIMIGLMTALIATGLYLVLDSPRAWPVFPFTLVGLIATAVLLERDDMKKSRGHGHLGPSHPTGTFPTDDSAR